MPTREETQARMNVIAAGMMKHTPEQSYTVTDRLEERAAQQPGHPFLVYEGQTISYAEVNRQANRFAHFAASLGLRKGDVAALLMENRPEFLYLWFGLAKIGCISALINTQIGGEALRHALATTASQKLFVGAECLERLTSAPGIPGQLDTYVMADGAAKSVPDGCIAIEPHLIGQPDGNPDPARRDGVIGQSTLCLVFTSGTTGLPKAARITHARWLGVGEGWCDFLGLGPEDGFYCVLPLYHVAALMSLLSNAMAAGGRVVLRRRFSTSRFWRDIREHGITVAQYSGEMCRYLFSQPPTPDDHNHRLRVMTGSGLSPSIWRAFKERFGVSQMIEGYGGTEINVGMMNIDDRIGSCGRIPFRDRSNARLVKYDRETASHIRNPDGTLIECGPDEVGEMLGMILNLPGITGGRFDGYTDAGATEKKILRNAFQPGDAWFRTGDLFRRDEDDYYYFVDRVGDTYRWKSENVSTTEVANVLAEYPGVETITVYGVPIAGQEGRAGMATVVMQPGKRLDPAAFHKLAAARLPGYAMPVFVRTRSNADITATFKLRKVDLQKLGYASEAGDEVFVADAAAGRYVAATTDNLTRLGIPSASAGKPAS
jgi:fatty-acyl-CoA synthase